MANYEKVTWEGSVFRSFHLLLYSLLLLMMLLIAFLVQLVSPGRNNSRLMLLKILLLLSAVRILEWEDEDLQRDIIDVYRTAANVIQAHLQEPLRLRLLIGPWGLRFP